MKRMKEVLILLVILLVTTATAMISLGGIAGDDLSAKGISLGLDLAGGVSITYQAEEGSNPSAQEMEGALNVIQHRLDAKGYTEATAMLEGDKRIRVEIPGVSNASQAVEEIGRTAMLRFVGIDLPAFLNSGALEEFYDQYVQDVRDALAKRNTSIDTSAAEENSDSSTTYLDVDTLTDEEIRQDAINYFTNYTSSALTRYPRALEVAIEQGYASEVVTGTNVTDATYQKGQLSSSSSVEPYVKLEFDKIGKDLFAEGTRQYLNKRIIILLDDTVICMPNVSTVIADGTAVITNIGTEEEARNLATDIVGGALPVKLVDIDHTSVGATLGMNALTTSIKAGIIGLILIMIFLIVLYRIPGIAASLALVFYVSLELLLINVLGWTLTLPGIAGFILSIGMAVDANIIIFARIKEELLSGHTVRVSVKNGFGKALSAILDGNITTLIAAVVLYFFGSGTIKGFAQTLGLGIVLSMFSALVVTRLLLNSALPFLPDSPWLYTTLWTKTAKEGKRA